MAELFQSFQGKITNAVIFANRLVRIEATSSRPEAYLAIAHLQQMKFSILLLMRQTTFLKAASTFQVGDIGNKILAISVTGTIKPMRALSPVDTSRFIPQTAIMVFKVDNIQVIDNPSKHIRNLENASVVRLSTDPCTFHTHNDLDTRTEQDNRSEISSLSDTKQAEDNQPEASSLSYTKKTKDKQKRGIKKKNLKNTQIAAFKAILKRLREKSAVSFKESPAEIDEGVHIEEQEEENSG